MLCWSSKELREFQDALQQLRIAVSFHFYEAHESVPPRLEVYCQQGYKKVIEETMHDVLPVAIHIKVVET